MCIRKLKYRIKFTVSQITALDEARLFWCVPNYRNTFKWMIRWYVDMAEVTKMSKKHNGNFGEEHLLKFKVRTQRIGAFPP